MKEKKRLTFDVSSDHELTEDQIDVLTWKVTFSVECLTRV